MDQLIPIMSRIQGAMASVRLDSGLDLPQIAVVGGQSVGKSSVIEGFVGRGFLPTGTGVVTRRPLLLNLTSTKSRGGPRPEREWGEFEHLPGKEFESFDDIRDEIVKETHRICGDKQVISPLPIVLRILSPNVIDLTLVDLPGITHVPIGDQPQDIGRHIRALILEHITRPNCLILAVAGGNSDLATADALAISREVDPDGNRTLGVLTKLDLKDQISCDVVPALEGRLYPLRLGFIGVVNRSFHDVKGGKSLAEHLQGEDQFFVGHSPFRGVAHRCGSAYLAKFLNRILLDHIRESLPDIKSRMLRLRGALGSEMEALGEKVSGQRADQGALLLGLFTKFSGRFSNALDGKMEGPQNLPQGHLVGRARIDFIFRDVFARTVADFDVFSGLTDADIRIAIRNATGPRATLFVPEAAFELLVKRQIAKLEAPSLQCAELVFEELQRVALMSDLLEFRRFTVLRDRMYTVVRTMLRRCLEPTQEMIRNIIKIELAYVNTNHPDFVGSAGAMRIAGQAAASGKSATQELPSGLPPPEPPVATPSPPSTSPRTNENEADSVGGGLLGFFRRSTPNLLKFDDSGVRQGSTASTNTARQPAEQRERRLSSVDSGRVRLPHMPATMTLASSPPTGRERVEVEIIKVLLANYSGIVKKSVTDSVPKAVMFFMVNSVKDVIQRECVAQLYKEELFDLLLQEGGNLQGRREKCTEELEALNRAVELLDQVRDCGEL